MGWRRWTVKGTELIAILLFTSCRAVHCFFLHTLILAPSRFGGYEHHLQGAVVQFFYVHLLGVC
jgi:hypothetical protein